MNKMEAKDKVRMTAMIIISLLVIVTGIAFVLTSLNRGNVAGAVGGGVIAILILAFAIFTFKRGYGDARKGFPLKDERSRKVLEKASSLAFYVTIYVLLAIGFLSEDVINFRDVSQATSLAIGCMAILFMVFWAWYNRQAI